MIQYLIPAWSGDRSNYWFIENIHNLSEHSGLMKLASMGYTFDRDEYLDFTPRCEIISRIIDFDQGENFRFLIHRDVAELLSPHLVKLELRLSEVTAILNGGPDLLCWFKLAL